MAYVSVGKILNFHGIQGEAKVGFSKNQEDFLAKLKFVYIKIKDVYEKFDVSVRFNKTFALIKFKGINSIEELIPYKGSLLFVDDSTIRETLAEDEFLIDELTGLDVYDLNDNLVGTVIGVSNNGVNDFLSVKSRTKKICLVPFVNDLVPNVDIKSKKVIVNNIEGLIE